MDDRALEAELLRDPLFDPERGVTIAAPKGTGPGHWAGAPSATLFGGRVHLAYRVRAPAPERGDLLVVTSSADGFRFGAPLLIRKEHLGALSIERCALVPIAGELRLFVSFVAEADRRWRIDAMDLPLGRMDLRFAHRPVLAPDAIGAAAVKDPWVRRVGDLWLMFVSYGPLPERDAAGLHAGGDALSTGRVLSQTGLATSHDGRSWSWLGPVLEPSAGRWDDHTTRLTAAVRVRDRWVGLYDGSTVEGNYEERCGLAFSDDLVRWRKAGADGPLIGTASGAGGVRYVDVCEMPAGGLRAYYEFTRSDGSHELRTAPVRDLARNLR